MNLKCKVRMLSVVFVVLDMATSAATSFADNDGTFTFSDFPTHLYFVSRETQNRTWLQVIVDRGIPLNPCKLYYILRQALDSNIRKMYLREIIGRSSYELERNIFSRCVSSALWPGVKYLYLQFLSNQQDGFGNNLLHWAAREGRLDVFKDVLECLPSIYDEGDDYHMLSCVNKFRLTPLHVAVCSGNCDLVKFILEYIFNSRDKHFFGDRYKLLRSVIDLKDINGCNALQLALKLNKQSVCRIIENTPQIIAAVDSYDNKPLEPWAALGEISKELSLDEMSDDARLEFTVTSEEEKRLISLVTSETANMNVHDGLTLLQWAEFRGMNILVRHLISLGAH